MMEEVVESEPGTKGEVGVGGVRDTRCSEVRRKMLVTPGNDEVNRSAIEPIPLNCKVNSQSTM